MARLGGGGAAATKPAKPAPAPARRRPSGGSFIGLDIGTSSIKAVEVKGANNGFTVTAIATANTPPGLIQNGLVADPKALGTAIKQLLGKNGLRAGKVVTAATGPDAVVVRVIEVPRMTPAELADTMKWEIERHIPFSASDVEMGYQAIDDAAAMAADPNNPNMEVLLAVARRDMVALHLDTLGAAGVRPVAIDIEPLAVGRALLDLDRTGRTSKNVVIVNIGASATEVSIFRSGILRFPRTIPLAGDSLTRAISDQLGLSLDAAEDEKRQYATVLMEMVQQAGGYNPFAAAASAPQPDYGGTAFDAAPIPPPMFGGAPAADIPPPPVFDVVGESSIPTTPASDDPFASANAFDPFANAAGGGGSGGGGVPAPAPDDPLAQKRRDIFNAIQPILNEITMEVRRSVDYFRSRYPSDTVDQILLCGGTACIPAIDQYFEYEMGVPTVVADPFAGINVSSKQMSAERRREVAPMFAVALGLAARDAILGS